MLPTPLPRAFDLLADRPDAAADAALAECLPHFSGATQEAVVRILTERGHTETLVGLIRGFRDFDDSLRTVILGNAVGLFAGIRTAIQSGSVSDRVLAVEVITRADAPQLAELLADALRADCAKTRVLAGRALRTLTSGLLVRMQCGRADPPTSYGGSGLDDLTIALQRTVVSWEAHTSAEALEAATWLSECVEPAIRRKLQDPKSRLLPALKKRIQATTDARGAGFVIRALGIPQLRDTAAAVIPRIRDAGIKLELVRHAPLLEDQEVVRGWRTIRDWQWLLGSADLLAKLTGSDAEHAVRMVAAAGGHHDRKMVLYRRLLNVGHDDVRHAVLATLAADRSEPACILMRLIAGRSDDPMASQASRLLHDRPRQAAATVAEPSKAHVAQSGPSHPLVLQDLKIGLAHQEPLVRARSLQRLRTMGGVPQLATDVYRLAHDPEPVVRSLAVALLSELPGATSQRILRTAINDPDERVQANAIEAMDRLNLPERVALTAPKLCAESSRIRANAVKSLLRTELRQSAETLLDMLEAASPSDRLSALWVIERMGLSTLLDRLHELGKGDPDEQVRTRANAVVRTLLGQQVLSSWWHTAAGTNESDAEAEGEP